jgi:hypothetical protein
VITWYDPDSVPRADDDAADLCRAGRSCSHDTRRQCAGSGDARCDLSDQPTAGRGGRLRPGRDESDACNKAGADETARIATLGEKFSTLERGSPHPTVLPLRNRSHPYTRHTPSADPRHAPCPSPPPTTNSLRVGVPPPVSPAYSAADRPCPPARGGRIPLHLSQRAALLQPPALHPMPHARPRETWRRSSPR